MEGLEVRRAGLEAELADMKRKLEEASSLDWDGSGERHILYLNGGIGYRLDPTSFNTLQQGNYFRKREHAEAMRNIRAKWGQFMRVAIELADGWEPDWDNHNQNKWIASYNHYYNSFRPYSRGAIEDTFQIYLPAPEKAQQLADWANKNVVMK